MAILKRQERTVLKHGELRTVIILAPFDNGGKIESDLVYKDNILKVSREYLYFRGVYHCLYLFRFYDDAPHPPNRIDLSKEIHFPVAVASGGLVFQEINRRGLL